MAVLIAPDVVRVTLKGMYLGRNVANIQDFVVHDVPLGGDRNDAIKGTMVQVLDAWAEFVRTSLGADMSFTGLDWVDLNSADGATGSLTSTDDHTLPVVGTGGGEALTGQVALLLTKVCSARRGARNGRMYVAGLTESNVTGNYLASGVRAALQTTADTLLEAWTETGVISPPFTFFPTVVHTRAIGPGSTEVEYVGNSQITTLEVQSQLASQRRRNRG